MNQEIKIPKKRGQEFRIHVLYAGSLFLIAKREKKSKI
jgi:hypothetical protein